MSLQWFARDLPIRRKFVVLRRALTLTGMIALIATLWAGSGGGVIAPEILAVLDIVASLALITVAARMICDPYVATVERMEALAAGDLDSPVAHTDHTDCVGRMTRAMTIFASNARDLRQSNDQKRIVAALDHALGRLADADLTFRITDALPGQGEVLRKRYNDAVETLTDAEIARAKAQMKAGLLMALESCSSRAEQLARHILAYGRPLGVDEIVARIEAVTRDSTRDAARTLLARSRPAVVALGSGRGLETAAAHAESLCRPKVSYH